MLEQMITLLEGILKFGCRPSFFDPNVADASDDAFSSICFSTVHDLDQPRVGYAFEVCDFDGKRK